MYSCYTNNDKEYDTTHMPIRPQISYIENVTAKQNVVRGQALTSSNGTTLFRNISTYCVNASSVITFKNNIAKHLRRTSNT